MRTNTTDNPRDNALLSDDRRYRYWLTRAWAPRGPLATFVMLNPSIADAAQDDATIRRCTGFARTWGLSGITVVNLYALISTNPAGLWRAEDPIGPDNDSHIEAAATLAGQHSWPIVAAWGVNARPDRVAAVRRLAGMDRLTALRSTKAGHPGHPLRLRRDSALVPWPALTAAGNA
ncbi:MAG: DUF1643 domain-containing protein [Humibacillus sp.]|nr:DUF1643 domain-containing protein [Humibacillus sp.]MDN5780082.1 DUF1643 domain-containing protein [Humibacillus sp.]